MTDYTKFPYQEALNLYSEGAGKQTNDKIELIAAALTAAEQRGAEAMRALACQVAINKGVRNGHIETCAAIAEIIAALAYPAPPPTDAGGVK